MSLPCTSRTVISVSPSLADVFAVVGAADLPERRRQDLASAVRAAARAIGRPPEQIPADPRLLASRLAEVAPQSAFALQPRLELEDRGRLWLLVGLALPARAAGRARLARRADHADRVKAFVTDMLTISATGTVLSHLQELSDAARVMNPTRDWRWIRRIEARVRAIHEPARSKRDRLVGAADLLALGQKLMQSAPALSTDRLRAMQFRDGLIIALLAARPLRLKNLTGLALERSLVRRGEGWWIAIPAEETKTREPIEVPWPEALSGALDVYLHQHRRVLCRLRSRWTWDVGGALWVSGGAPLGKDGIYGIIVRRTAEAFGKPIKPHLFRDCAATSIAIEDPAHVRIASQILGHRSTATTERYYNQAQAIDAARRYQHFLVGLRNGTMAQEKEPV